MNTALFPIAGPLEGQLPWDSCAEDERRFHRVLSFAVACFVLFSVAVPFMPLQELVREPAAPEEIPLAKIVLEPKKLPDQSKPEPMPVPQIKPEPVAPEPRPVEREVVKTVAPKPKPVDPLKKARDTAAAAGLLAFKDDLQAMRDTVDVNALNQTQTRRGEAQAKSLSRNLVASKKATVSSGITTDNLSTDTGGPALSGRETVAVRSTLAGDPSAGKQTSGSTNSSHERLGGRSDDAIRRVMDSNKGAIFAIYNRALRADPLLEGKLVFEMVIEPDGSVSAVERLSSELEDDGLTRKILSRIRLIRFGAAGVQRTRVNYSFDFLPHI